MQEDAHTCSIYAFFSFLLPSFRRKKKNENSPQPPRRSGPHPWKYRYTHTRTHSYLVPCHLIAIYSVLVTLQSSSSLPPIVFSWSYWKELLHRNTREWGKKNQYWLLSLQNKHVGGKKKNTEKGVLYGNAEPGKRKDIWWCFMLFGGVISLLLFFIFWSYAHFLPPPPPPPFFKKKTKCPPRSLYFCMALHSSLP